MVSKAFDTVNHKILLSKLYANGIRGTPLKWFESYLTNRNQSVRIGNVESGKLTITCGVPQGSILGPLLFLLYINDLPNCYEKISFRIFANDTNIFFSSENPTEIEFVMNLGMKAVLHYCNINKLSISFKKTNYMLISPPQKATNIILSNITRKTPIKYLCVFIDEHLNWGPQILHINNKVSRNMGIINELKYYLDIHTLTQLYYTLIYPYLSYGITNWGNTYKSRLIN